MSLVIFNFFSFWRLPLNELNIKSNVPFSNIIVSHCTVPNETINDCKNERLEMIINMIKFLNYNKHLFQFITG